MIEDMINSCFPESNVKLKVTKVFFRKDRSIKKIILELNIKNDK